MNKKDEKRAGFFVHLFIVCFVVCEVVRAAGYIKEQKEYGYGIEQILLPFGKNKDLLSGTSENPVEQEGEGLPQENVQESTTEGQKQETEENVGSEQGEQLPRGFVTVTYDYFDDALFIGDSRTEGLMEYGDLENAVFFADSGMSVFSLESKKLPLPERGKVSIEEILLEKQYGKIYLMLGINELGYQFEVLEKKYQETLAYIREYQSEAVIFLCANLHVAKAQSDKDAIYNNANVNRVNEMIAGLADGQMIFYIDVNELFDDENGNLSEEHCADSFHVFAKDYKTWVDWLCTKGIED